MASYIRLLQRRREKLLSHTAPAFGWSQNKNRDMGTRSQAGFYLSCRYSEVRPPA